jgi:hypothetical protein
LTYRALDTSLAKLEFCSRRKHLEHLTTSAGERGTLGVGAMAQLTVPLGMGH